MPTFPDFYFSLCSDCSRNRTEEDRKEYGLSTGAVTDDRRHLGPKSSEISCVLAIDVTINL